MVELPSAVFLGTNQPQMYWRRHMVLTQGVSDMELELGLTLNTQTLILEQDATRYGCEIGVCNVSLRV